MWNKVASSSNRLVVLATRSHDQAEAPELPLKVRLRWTQSHHPKIRDGFRLGECLMTRKNAVVMKQVMSWPGTERDRWPFRPSGRPTPMTASCFSDWWVTSQQMRVVWSGWALWSPKTMGVGIWVIWDWKMDCAVDDQCVPAWTVMPDGSPTGQEKSWFPGRSALQPSAVDTSCEHTLKD